MSQCPNRTEMLSRHYSRSKQRSTASHNHIVRHYHVFNKDAAWLIKHRPKCARVFNSTFVCPDTLNRSCLCVDQLTETATENSTCSHHSAPRPPLPGILRISMFVRSPG